MDWHPVWELGKRGSKGCPRDALEGGANPLPLPGRPAYAQPLSSEQQVPASMALATDSHRPQPLWQPPPTAYLTASGADSEVTSLLMPPPPPQNAALPIPHCPPPHCSFGGTYRLKRFRATSNHLHRTHQTSYGVAPLQTGPGWNHPFTVGGQTPVVGCGCCLLTFTTHAQGGRATNSEQKALQ